MEKIHKFQVKKNTCSRLEDMNRLEYKYFIDYFIKYVQTREAV